MVMVLVWGLVQTGGSVLAAVADDAAYAAVVATIVSLLVEWFPWFRAWWEKHTPSQKQGYMAAAVAVITLAVVGVDCARGGVCPADPLAFLVNVFLAFLAAASVQQGVHRFARVPAERVLGSR